MTRATTPARVAPPPRPHGGRLSELARLFPDARHPFIDLSTGINPVAYPVPPLPQGAFTRLPEPGDVTRLEAAAWFERFGRPGIPVRRFAEATTWLRLGMPGDAPARARLAAALRGMS